MLQDLKFGLKLLWKQKAFTISALLTLALCIGANTAIFTVLNAIVLRGLPFSEPDRLVTMYNVYPGVGVDKGSNGVPDYLDRHKLTDVFSDVALIGNNGYDAGLEGSPKRIQGQYVTPSYFKTLRAEPILGRAFTEEEAVLGKEKVVLLSEGLWKDMFGRDPHVLGKDLRLSGSPYRIVGVMAEGFGILGDSPRLWVPFAFTPQQTSDDARHSNNWDMIARLQPGITLSLAQQRLDILNKENMERYPKYRELLINARFATKVTSLKDEMTADIRPTLYLLQIAVGAVLLIGCVNLANLMLVRSSIRMKELAIRYSLGAGRLRLSRQLLTESLTLSILGGALGIAVGYAGVRLLAILGAKELPRGSGIAIDGTVLAFTAAIAIFTGLLFGSIPLISMFRNDLNHVFRSSERTGTTSGRALWIRSALVVSQISLAFVLLIGSGLLTLSFARLMNVNPGFHAESVLTAHFSLPSTRYKDDATARGFITTLLERVRTLPGVHTAGAITTLPFADGNNSSVLSVEGHPLKRGENPPVPQWSIVDSGYFPTMNIALMEGRNFTEADTAEAQKVVVIDQFLAKRYWPNGDAVGGKVRQGVEAKDPLMTVIGVVANIKSNDLAEKSPVGHVYWHYKQEVPRSMYLVAKAEREGTNLTSAIRQEITRADPELPMYDTKTMTERISQSLLNRRAAMILCMIFGGLALLLSAIGVYGVLAYTVTQRTREIGIRVALGAEVRDVLRLVLGQGLRLAGIGLVAGAICALALTRLMTSMLYDVQPADPIVFIAGATTLGLVALIASLIPSLRALRIKPAIALRYE